jgi:hypothetical protein
LGGSHFTTKRHIVPLIADALPAFTSFTINHTISAAAARQLTSVVIVDESASATRRAVTTALDDLGFFA